MAGPLDPTPTREVSFAELDALRVYLERLLDRAVPTLKLYCDPVSGGFMHLLRENEPGDFSKASTATCGAFLIRSDRWREADAPWSDKAPALVDAIIYSDWDSAELGPGNSFTVSFLLEALCDLSTVEPFTSEQRDVAQSCLMQLKNELSKGAGIAIKDYPPTTFLTHKVTRVLRAWNELDGDLAAVTAKWAWDRLHEESVTISMKSPDADPYELAYGALIVSLCTPIRDMPPRRRAAFAYAISQFFDLQNDRGEWPRSRPLFVYPRLGNAYCYEYELLTQMLADRQLDPLLHDRLDELKRAAYILDETKIPLGEPPSEAIGWSTGHLKQEVTNPESWSTASAFHYCHYLHRLVIEAIRRSVFQYAGTRYVSPSELVPSGVIDSERFLDSPIEFGPDQQLGSLTQVLEERFLKPISLYRDRLDQGHPMPADVPTSAILYGPPGTSKTQLAQMIGDYLGWPLLKLDPSHLTRNGLDKLHAETHRVFVMLQGAAQMVVLFDEFDELVRDRDEQDMESASRFLTTAMLPKIEALSTRRRLVYLLATNHLERFDPAISRPGRFDMIVPVMPPTLEAKFGKWPVLKDKLDQLGFQEAEHADKGVFEGVAVLTYLECKRLVDSVAEVDDRREFQGRVNAAAERATVNQNVGGDKSWKDRIREQQSRIRIP